MATLAVYKDKYVAYELSKKNWCYKKTLYSVLQINNKMYKARHNSSTELDIPGVDFLSLAGELPLVFSPDRRKEF